MILVGIGQVETETVEEVVEIIPYDTVEIETEELLVGETEVRAEGFDGNVTHVIEIDTFNGEEIDRRVVNEVTMEPTDEIIWIGTREPLNVGIVQSEVLRLTNEVRQNAGASPLRQNSTLQSVANTRAIDLQSSYSHIRPNGNPWESLIPSEEKNQFSGLGENINVVNSRALPDASEQAVAERLVDEWVNSSGHYENMVEERFSVFGVGIYVDSDTQQVFATQNFGQLR